MLAVFATVEKKMKMFALILNFAKTRIFNRGLKRRKKQEVEKKTGKIGGKNRLHN